MYIPKIGDIVKDNGYNVVVVDMKNYEYAGSCSYDRKYFLVDEEYLRNNQGVVTLDDLINHGRWVIVRGTTFPEIEQVKDLVPFNIARISAFDIKEKTANVITVWE